MAKGIPLTHVDGDFKTRKGDCEYHCSPTCHPAQVGPEWLYGCLHKAWPGNREGDFCPIVDCDGEKSKCKLRSAPFVGRYKGGLKRRIKNALAKATKYQKLLNEIIDIEKENPND